MYSKIETGFINWMVKVKHLNLLIPYLFMMAKHIF